MSYTPDAAKMKACGFVIKDTHWPIVGLVLDDLPPADPAPIHWHLVGDEHRQVYIAPSGVLLMVVPGRRGMVFSCPTELFFDQLLVAITAPQ